MRNHFQSINPVDNNVIGEYYIESWAEVDTKIQQSANAFNVWKNQSFEYRSSLFKKAGQVLNNNKSEYALKITQEMGKPIAQARAEVEKCAWVCQYYAEHCADFLKDQIIETEFNESYVTFQPLGTILQIMPWNFPFWQVFRFSVPALISGNVTLLKHAPNVMGCANLIQDVFKLAGFPSGVFQNISVRIDTIEKILKQPSIQGVALTGSLNAGSAVGKLAGKQVKKCILELGGADAFIVLEDALLEDAARCAVQSRMHNSGQTCISAKRFIVVESVADKFKALVIDELSKLIIGDPINPNTNISPLARLDLAEKLEIQVQRSIAMGAVVDFKGGHKKGTNYFFPTLLTNIKKEMPAYNEEMFGPVIALFVVKNSKEAIKLANDSIYGLGATIWSNNTEHAKSVAMQLEVGAVAINRIMSSDPRIPFGGIKMSGIGRELGKEGLMSFVNVKSVIIE
ncbi:MAG: NAD-dependent succinate-semialdehyde dehydrogenase [Saprospiraceae bacterium]|nr:NAD-dependent succinate-semialdehyde dehydrogenase [Saprospiraceae bacterium]